MGAQCFKGLDGKHSRAKLSQHQRPAIVKHIREERMPEQAAAPQAAPQLSSGRSKLPSSPTLNSLYDKYFKSFVIDEDSVYERQLSLDRPSEQGGLSPLMLSEVLGGLCARITYLLGALHAEQRLNRANTNCCGHRSHACMLARRPIQPSISEAAVVWSQVFGAASMQMLLRLYRHRYCVWAAMLTSFGWTRQGQGRASWVLHLKGSAAASDGLLNKLSITS